MIDGMNNVDAVPYASHLYSLREVADAVGISLLHVKLLVDNGDVDSVVVLGDIRMMRGRDVNALAENVRASTARMRSVVTAAEWERDLFGDDGD